MAVRPIILKGPGKPKRKWSSQLQGGPPNPVAPFFSVPGQTEERPSTVIWPSQVAGSTSPVVSAEFVWGTHAVATYVAEALKSSVFRSVAAAVVITAAVPAFIFAPQQAYADVNQSFVESPLRGATPRTIPPLSTVPQVDLTQQGWIARPQAARQGAVPPITQGQPQNNPSQLSANLTPVQPTPVTAVTYAVEQLYAAPQLLDLTQQGWIEGPQAASQGRVPPITLGDPQDDPSQLVARLTPAQPSSISSVVPAEYTWGTHAVATHVAEALKSSIFRSLATPPAATPGPVAPFFSIPPQVEERPTRSVWPSQVSGNTPPVIAQLRGGPQLVDLTQQSNLTQPSVVPPLVSYAVSPLYAAPQLADFTQQGWIKGAAPVRQGGVPDRNWASQADPSQIAAQVFPSVVTPPIFIGDVPPLVLAGQPQANTDQIPAVIWTPLVFGEPPPEPAFEIIIGGDDAPRKKKKRRKSSIEELNDLLDRVVEENTPPAPASKKALKQITDAITDQDDDDDEEALIALT